MHLIVNNICIILIEVKIIHCEILKTVEIFKWNKFQRKWFNKQYLKDNIKFYK